jgi:hypothetical protein
MGPECRRIQCRDQRNKVQYQRELGILHHPLISSASVRQSTGEELTPLNGKDLSTGTGSSSDRVGSVDLSECRRDSKGEGDGFGDE